MTHASVPARFAVQTLAAIGLMLGASGCTSPSSPGSNRYLATTGGAAGRNLPPAVESFWQGDGVGGSPKIEIDLSAQRLRYFRGDQVVGQSPISSGREGHSTTNGTFRIVEKDLNHRSSIYGAFCDKNGDIVVEDVDARRDRAPAGTHFVGASMRYFMRVTGAVGMHEGYLPGYPASHGCIRLPSHMAEAFFRATPGGTTVVIRGSAAEAEATAPIHDPTLGGARATPALAAAAGSGAQSKKKQETAAAAIVQPKKKQEPMLMFGRKKPVKPNQRVLTGQTLYL